jgi:hypothetical protein
MIIRTIPANPAIPKTIQVIGISSDSAGGIGATVVVVVTGFLDHLTYSVGDRITPAHPGYQWVKR